MAAEGERPTWKFLLVLGLIGGGPTFVGTLVGQSFVNDTLYLGSWRWPRARFSTS